MDAEQRRRYSRNISIPGIGSEGQEALLKSSVCVLGAGALGSIAAMYLAGSGVGRIKLADFDTIDISNLQRQILYRTSEAGESKCSVLTQKIHELNPDVRVEEFRELISEKNIDRFIGDADFIIEGSDNPATKYMVDKACGRLGKPYVLGGVSGFRGQLFTHIPGSSSYSDIFPETREDSGYTPCSIEGVIGPMPGIIAALEAAEAIKYLTKSGEPAIDRIICFDLRHNILESFSL